MDPLMRKSRLFMTHQGLPQGICHLGQRRHLLFVQKVEASLDPG